MLLVGLLLNLGYSYLNYRTDYRRLQDSVSAQARELGNLLEILVLDDLRFERYYELWEKLDRILRRQAMPGMESRFYEIRSIVVVNRCGHVVGHTQPADYPLLTVFEPPFDDPDDETDNQLHWIDGQETAWLEAAVFYGDEFLGDVLVELDTRPLKLSMQGLVWRALAYQTLLFAVVLGLAIWFGRWLSRPLEQAVSRLDRIGSGTVALPELRSREDEFRSLGEAIEAADRRIARSRSRLEAQQRELVEHRDRLEHRVAERTRELEDANRELAAFSYSVSHDLRAPLRAVDGFAQALDEDYGDTLEGEARHYLDRIRAGVQRMGMLIDDMLMLSRVSRQEMLPSRVNLSALAEDIRRELEADAPERQVQWTIAPDIVVEGDRNLLGILLRNLLGNAWKYTGRNDEARIEFGCESDTDGRTVCYVRDNGAGFDMRYVDKLFGVFQRLHRDEEFPGTGVGLAIAQRVVHRHGGRIWAEGEVGRGAVFRFVLAGMATAAAERDGEAVA